MNPALLLPMPGDLPATPVYARNLRVWIGQGSRGIGVRRGLLDQRLLTWVHEKSLEYDLIATRIETPRLAPENPFLFDIHKEKLDSSGIVKLGTIVRQGDVLVSILNVVQARGDRPGPGPGMQLVRNDSREVVASCDGMTVTMVRRLTPRQLGRYAPKGLVENIHIELRAERALAIGDILLTGEEPLGIIDHFVADADMPCDEKGVPVDLVLPLEAGNQLGITLGLIRSLPIGRAAEEPGESLQARDMGPYSLISCTPLHGRDRWPGQPVNIAQVKWLRERELNGILTELTCLKSDDLQNRRQLSTVSKAGTLANAANSLSATPESLILLRTWLMALGLNVSLKPHGSHVAIAINPATTDDIIGWSSGMISRPETIHFRTYDEIVGGLFCPKVFGPIEGPRRRRFGHLPLVAPIVPYLWRCGSSSVLERVLEMPMADLERVLQYKADVFWKNGQIEIRDSDSRATYIAEGESLGSGGIAIREMLSRLPVERLPPALVGRHEALTPSVISIIPPDIRPLVLLDNGNFATHDVNDLYRSVINRRNRIAKLIDLNAPLVIIRNELRMCQDAVDRLHMNTLLPKSGRRNQEETEETEESKDRVLCDFFKMVAQGLLTESKLTDWSGRARLAVIDDLPMNQALIPEVMYRILLLETEKPILLTVPEGPFVALMPQSHDEYLIRVTPSVLVALGLDTRAIAECMVHRPISREACDEAMQLTRGVPSICNPVPDRTGWLDGRDAQEILTGLIAAALDGEAVHWDSARGLLLGGSGPVEVAPDSELTVRSNDSTGPKIREVPIPSGWMPH